MRLVRDWRNCHKWLSIQLSLLGVVATALWDYVPALNSSKITMAMFIIIAIGRVVDQEKKDASSS